jgi:hypothetical protein
MRSWEQNDRCAPLSAMSNRPFDWTLRQQRASQFLTYNLVETLYKRLFLRKTVGYAFQEYFKPLVVLYLEGEQALNAYNRREETLPAALYCRLASRDTQSMVILGDPTVAFQP